MLIANRYRARALIWYAIRGQTGTLPIVENDPTDIYVTTIEIVSSIQLLIETRIRYVASKP